MFLDKYKEKTSQVYCFVEGTPEIKPFCLIIYKVLWNSADGSRWKDGKGDLRVVIEVLSEATNLVFGVIYMMAVYRQKIKLKGKAHPCPERIVD